MTAKELKLLKDTLRVRTDLHELLIEEVPLKEITLKKIINGSHKPSELLYRRIFSVLVSVAEAAAKSIGMS